MRGGRQSGLDDFLSKPYRLAEIFDCMARHLGVRYVRAKDAPRPGAQAALRPEDLRSLPDELRDELANAVISLDRASIDRVIQRVAECNVPLGAALAHHAERFAYTAIVEAVKTCQPKMNTD